ncbi:YceI family protein [Hymenobacter monticola]|uniref:YceI family protein n=2 Tax=Hymenobacter monticola TaxID=1705399 RepID=A0ABY4B0M6_9BACT|nr:YceI family protein [Hymenobacter monticola]
MASEDFFDSKKYPTAAFKLVSVVPIKGAAADADNATITGDLTIKDKTQRISFPAKVGVKGDLAAIAGKVVFDRTKFGINYGSESYQTYRRNDVRDPQSLSHRLQLGFGSTVEEINQMYPPLANRAISDDIALTFNLIAKS